MEAHTGGFYFNCRKMCLKEFNIENWLQLIAVNTKKILNVHYLMKTISDSMKKHSVEFGEKNYTIYWIKTFLPINTVELFES